MAINSNLESKSRISLFGTDWKIEKSSRQCSICKKQFVEEALYFSALYDEISTPGGFTRKDFCLPCWQRGEEQVHGSHLPLFSFWRTHIPRPDTPPKKRIDTSALLDFFLSLESNPDPEKKKLRYALALFLMRKKLLKYKGVVRNKGPELLMLEYPQENKTFEVVNPLLTEEEIASLATNLVRLLDLEGTEMQ